MINLILLVFTGSVFYAGFAAGNRFKTIGEMASHGIGKFKSWLDENKAAR